MVVFFGHSSVCLSQYGAAVSSEGLVRRVRVLTSGKKELERDVKKIVLLEREGEGDSAEEAGDGGGGGDSDGGECE